MECESEATVEALCQCDGEMARGRMLVIGRAKRSLTWQEMFAKIANQIQMSEDFEARFGNPQKAKEKPLKSWQVTKAEKRKDGWKGSQGPKADSDGSSQASSSATSPAAQNSQPKQTWKGWSGKGQAENDGWTVVKGKSKGKGKGAKGGSNTAGRGVPAWRQWNTPQNSIAPGKGKGSTATHPDVATSSNQPLTPGKGGKGGKGNTGDC